MQIRNKIILCLIFFLPATSYAQKADSELAGTYEGTGKINQKIILNTDGTFIYIPLMGKFDQNNRIEYEGLQEKAVGNWIFNGKVVILNPDKIRKEMKMETVETTHPSEDYITIKLIYIENKYNGDTITSSKKVDFPMWTIYINNTNKPILLVRDKKFELGMIQSSEEKIYLDESNTFKISRKDFKKIGIFNWNFDNILWYKILDVKNNLLTFEFKVPDSFENLLSNKKLIIKNKKLYQYVTDNGRIDKSVSEIPLVKLD